MKNYALRTKLLLMVGVCACFLLGLIAVAVAGLTTQKQAINEIVSQRLARYSTVMSLYADLLKIATTLHELNQNLQKEMSSEEFDAQAQGIRGIFERNVAQVNDTLQHEMLTEQERAAFERVFEQLKSYQTAAILGLRNSRSQALFAMQLKNLQIRQGAIEQEVVTLRDYEAQASQQTYARVGVQVLRMIFMFIGTGVFCLISLVVIARVILRATVEPIQAVVAYAQRIAKGDLAMEIVVNRRDEAGQLLSAMQHMITRIKAIVNDLGALTSAAKEGNLGVRADVAAHHGEFAAIVQGVNDTLDAVVSPLHVATESMNRVAKGDIPDVILEEYRGDFASIKASLNLLIAAMQTITSLAEKMAQGDLTAEVAERSQQDNLMPALNSMLTRLNDTIWDVKAAVETVTTGSQNMSSVAEQMSQGTSQQAAAAQEASSSMEQMAANIRQNADNAKIMEAIAMESAKDARRGEEAVANTIEAMRAIASRISVIQEIAGQTNILSMNATIEAAKAEDYGKGFAVVATEVRALAKRSREAAEEIEQLVASCVTISEQAGDVLQRLVPNSEKTASVVQEISAASHEQSVGAEQVNRAIQQLDQVIQENAATAEQMASSAEALAMQAAHLQNAIAFFTVKERRPEAQTLPEEQALLHAIQMIRATPMTDDAQLLTLIRKAMQMEAASIFATGAAQPVESLPSGKPPTLPKQGTPRDMRDEEFERF